jgi:hypothetical protein
LDAEIFERLNNARLTCAQALEAHWAILAERARAADVDDGADPDWLDEHERLMNEAAAAEAALLAAVRWSGPPATETPAERPDARDD